jgi:ABC-type branched-subunit amino acid transport system substrate-binding protein
MTPAVRNVIGALVASLSLGYLGLGPGGGAGPAGLSSGSGQVGAVAGQSQDETGDAGAEVLGSSESSSSGGAGGASGAGGSAASGASCSPGRNGGKTDRGVSATKIRLAATAVLDGPAASLLKESPTGMRALVEKVNAGGGICGRAIELIVRNDSFDQRRGQDFIRTWASDPKEDIFALAVVPSAEGLGAAISAGNIAQNAIPVVGTDGMRREQYDEPWVWPVATATISTMRVMASYGSTAKKAKTFAIVWDSKYKFGKEGADAFRDQVGKLGGKIVADQALDPDRPAYSSEIDDFNTKCGNTACDMVALLLLPDTAQKWMSREPAMGRVYTAGAQTLFTDEFAKACADAAGPRCHGMAVWTGYNPPIDRYAGLPDVAAYVNDVKAIAPNADVRNQFLEGAYLGMTVMVEALKRVGPQVTRARLRAVMDSMDLKNEITAGLSWRPGKHFANVRARSFSMVLSGDRFLGWRDEQTGWVIDPAQGG